MEEYDARKRIDERKQSRYNSIKDTMGKDGNKWNIKFMTLIRI
jgi:hypothetical protein